MILLGAGHGFAARATTITVGGPGSVSGSNLTGFNSSPSLGDIFGSLSGQPAPSADILAFGDDGTNVRWALYMTSAAPITGFLLNGTFHAAPGAWANLAPGIYQMFGPQFATLSLSNGQTFSLDLVGV